MTRMLKYLLFSVRVILVEFISHSITQTVYPLGNEGITQGDDQLLGYDQLPRPPVITPEMTSSACECHTEHYQHIACRCFGDELTDIPNNLTSGVNKISLEFAGIEVLSRDSLQPYANSLIDIYMIEMHHLVAIENGTFLNLRFLRTIDIKRATKLKTLPDDLFDGIWPNLRILRIVHSALEVIPNLNKLRPTKNIFAMMDFDSNRIRNITSGSIKVKAEYMTLDHNLIEFVQDWSFHSSQIAKLSLKGNLQLKRIGPDAFTGLQNLRRLDLSQTKISALPTRGLEDLEVLRITDTFTLKEFPSVLHFREIREAYLTYSYHCCAFTFPNTHDPAEYARMQSLWSDVLKKHCSPTLQTTTEEILDTRDISTIPPKRVLKSFNGFHFSKRKKDDETFGEIIYTAAPLNTSNLGFDWGENQGFFQVGFDTIGDPQQYTDGFNGINEGTFHLTTVSHQPGVTPFRAFCGDFTMAYRNVTCHPEPDAFNPCEDVMGHWLLRICVWIVAVAAMLGNLAVVGVLLISARMTVSKFLMCHLAVADFCMGLYLLMIACVDLHTKGSYFNYAIHWQHGPGCQIAGFLTVFASELSIFTLTVITLERWYAITYAIHLNRRLQLGTAAKVMALGWLYAIAMASLPLVGISGYARTSICLPMEKDSIGDLAYLTCLLILNGIAFILVCACYIKMYVSIKVSRATRRHHKSECSDSAGASKAAHSDMSVAKRMAMLVFTDFACWTPISFFGLTAVAGYPLIDLTKSKILLVFFYPLNSFANPFLYAILTKQYRRDVCLICAKYFQKKSKSSDYPAKATGRTLSSNTQQHHRTTVSAIYRGSFLTRLHGHKLNTHARNVQKSHIAQSSPLDILRTPFTGFSEILRMSLKSTNDILRRSLGRSLNDTNSAILKQFKPKTNSARVSLTGLTTVQVHRKVSGFAAETSPNVNTEEFCQAGSPMDENLKRLENSRPATENKDDCSSDEDEEGKYSPAVRRGSPHPIKNSYAKLTCPSPEQELILRRALYVPVAETAGNTENADSVIIWSTPTKSSTETDATGSGVDNSTSTRDTNV